MNACSFQGRQAACGLLQHGEEVFHILGQPIETEVLRNTLHAPWLCVGLEGAQQEFTCILLVVGAPVRIAQDRQVGGEAVHHLGHHIEVFAGLQGHVDPTHSAHLPAPHARAVHDDFRANVPLVGGHFIDRAVAAFFSRTDGGDASILQDLGTTHPGALGQRHGGVDWVGLAVHGEIDRSHHVRNIDQRPHAFQGVVADHFDFQSEGTGHGGPAFEFLEPLLIGGDAQAAVLLEPGRLPGFLLQGGEKVGGVLRQSRHVGRRPQLAHQTGGVPGGTAG